MKQIIIALFLYLYFNQAEGETEVLVAGDPEKKHMEKVDKEGGLLYHKNLIKQMVCL